MAAQRDRISELEARLAGLERRRWRVKLAVGAGVLGALAVSSLAVGGVGDSLREGVRNGTTTRETEIIGRFNATTGAKGGYVTRQSNTRTGARAGGGAIYGCRGAAGGTASGSAPCLRASNLANGYAFEFASNAGPVGLFDAPSATDPPFVTDGGGLVANLNADKVDGKDAGAFLETGAKAADADKLDGKDSGEFATSADTGGAKMRSVFYAQDGAGAAATVLDLGGLVLQARCEGGNNLRVDATTTVDGSSIRSFPGAAAGGAIVAADDFDAGETVDILDDATTNSNNLQGTLTYTTPAGANVVMTYQAEEDGLDNDAVDCVFAGIATAAG